MLLFVLPVLLALQPSALFANDNQNKQTCSLPEFQLSINSPVCGLIPEQYGDFAWYELYCESESLNPNYGKLENKTKPHRWKLAEMRNFQSKCNNSIGLFSVECHLARNAFDFISTKLKEITCTMQPQEQHSSDELNILYDDIMITRTHKDDNVGLFVTEVALSLQTTNLYKRGSDGQSCPVGSEWHSISYTPEYREEKKDIGFCSITFCEAESFYHNYFTLGNKTTPHLNQWKRARTGERATLKDLCLERNGLPITRRCVKVGFTAKWEPLPDNLQNLTCLKWTKERIVTDELSALHDEILSGRRRLNESEGRRESVTLMRNIFRPTDKHLLPADLYLASQMLSALGEQQKDAKLSSELVSICNEVMSSDSRVLQLSAQINATNLLLNNFEEYMDALPEQMLPQNSCGLQVIKAAFEEENEAESGVEAINYSHRGVQALLTRNISVFFVNPACQNITGIAIYSEASSSQLSASHGGFWYRFLHANESVDSIKKEPGLETATFLPERLWQQVQKSGANFLVFKVYAHDALFVETTTQLSRRPRSKVLSISIPNLEGELPEAMPFLLRNENFLHPDASATQENTGCGYWNYRTWLSNGVTTNSGGSNLFKDPIIICHTKHLTSFAFLVGGSYRINDFNGEVLVTPLNERMLDIISVVGCSFSLAGLLGIWLTAALSKAWRNQASTKLLLHLCLPLTLQMIMFVFLNTDYIAEQLIEGRTNGLCVALGAALQYSILVLFTWMLIIAFLQFQRYVTVIGITRPKHYILKSALVAWTAPLLPTLLVVYLDAESYLPTSQLLTETGICYPSGYGLIFGVVLPVALITMANLVIFVYIFYSISHTLSQSLQHTERKLAIKQIRLSVLLFFLLGLSWIFGILAFLQAGVVFSYLFCLTATLQGFVLFVYFVVLNEVNRRVWLAFFCGAKTKNPKHELQSQTTSTN